MWKMTKKSKTITKVWLTEKKGRICSDPKNLSKIYFFLLISNDQSYDTIVICINYIDFYIVEKKLNFIIQGLTNFPESAPDPVFFPRRRVPNWILVTSIRIHDPLLWMANKLICKFPVCFPKTTFIEKSSFCHFSKVVTSRLCFFLYNDVDFTVCLRSLEPIYIVTDYIKWGKTS